MKRTLSDFCAEREGKEQVDVEKIKDLSKEEASKQLQEEVQKLKNQGKFDINAIENGLNSIKGILKEEEYNNILRTLQNLK